MVRQPPIVFGQQDYLQQLGIGNHTIASSGCYLTSMATVARYYGKQTDPVDLNNQFKQQLLYVNGDELVDDNLQKVYPDILFQAHYEFPNTPPTPADLNLLKALMADPTLSVILEISLPGGGTHFVVCVGVNGVVMIANPWDKQIEDFALLYGDPVQNIIKYVVYKGTPVASDNQALIDQLRSDRDRNWSAADSIAAYVGVQLNAADLAESVSQAKAAIDNYKNRIPQLTAARDDWQQKYEAEQKENIALNTTVSDLANSHKDYATQTVDAQHQAQDMTDYTHAITNALKVPRFDNQNDKDIVEQCLAEVSRLQKNQLPPPPPLQVVKNTISQTVAAVNAATPKVGFFYHLRKSLPFIFTQP